MKHMSWHVAFFVLCVTNVTVTTISVCFILNSWFDCSFDVGMLGDVWCFYLSVYSGCTEYLLHVLLGFPFFDQWFHVGVSINACTAKGGFMMANPNLKWMICGYPHDLGNLHVSKQFNCALQGIGSLLWDAQGMMVWWSWITTSGTTLFRCNLFKHVGKSHTHTCSGYNILVQRKLLLFPWWM